MLIVALILMILAAAFFAFDFFKSAWTTLTSLGLALMASGFAVWLVDILQDQGKL